MVRLRAFLGTACIAVAVATPNLGFFTAVQSDGRPPPPSPPSGAEASDTSQRRVRLPAFWVPIGLDTYVPLPRTGRGTLAEVELGKRLFSGTLLSADGKTSCATCHRPELAFTDGRRVAIGVYDRPGQRNVPTILNRAYGKSFFWDGRAASLEEQARNAIEGNEDLGLPIAEAVRRLGADETYRTQFAAAFDSSEPAAANGYPDDAARAPDAAVTGARLVHALATFVRSRLAGNSPVDRYRNGDPTALSTAALRGRSVFGSRGRCIACHRAPLYTDEQFHNTGVGWGVDPGRQAVTGRAVDRGRFKTPSLRNVALTAPYMHDGSIATLAEVVEFYDRGGGANPGLDPLLAPLHLSELHKADLVAFLESLTSAGQVTED